jgi:hypothetical protein
MAFFHEDFYRGDDDSSSCAATIGRSHGSVVREPTVAAAALCRDGNAEVRWHQHAM